MQALGVDVSLSIEPNVVLLNDDGLTTRDTSFKFTILPDGSTDPADPTAYYIAARADLDFFTVDQQNQESWQGMVVTTTTRGQGEVVYVAGTPYDVNLLYKAQVILNRGTSAEVRSRNEDNAALGGNNNSVCEPGEACVEKIVIPVAQLYVETKDPEFPDVKLRWDDYYPALGSKIITLRASAFLNGKVVNCEVVEPTAAAMANIISMTMPACTSASPQIINGTVKFRLTGADLAPMINNDPATGVNQIKLRFSIAQNASVPAIEATYHVRNNTNTTLQEVLNGETVFTADRDAVVSTSTGTTPDTRGFDYVQELLNQVVPRIRQTYDDTTNQWVTNQCALLHINGMYSDASYIAVMQFKRSFGLSADSSDTYRKLKKDYGLGATDADNWWWFYKVIEKEALIGKTQRIPADSEAITATNADTLQNSNPDNTQQDTGLYELYKNVVERFVNKMISEGELYRQSRGSNYPQANTSWRARTGETITESESYCFGCKNTYEQFWRTVTRCAPPAQGQVNGTYAGNVTDSGCGLTGSKRYPGLYQVELNTAQQYYAFEYWIGIDCAGFIQRTAMAGISLALPGVACAIPDLRDSDTDGNHLDDGGILAQAFFTDTSRVSYWSNPNEAANQVILQRKLRKGDLVRYGNTHNSMIYSDAPTCENNSCTYDILHAFSWECSNQNSTTCRRYPWFRKVGITTSGHPGLSSPTGFGRIKLWD